MKLLKDMNRTEVLEFLHEEGIDVDRVTRENVDTILKELADEQAWHDKRNSSPEARRKADADYRMELLERFLNAGDGQRRPCYCPYCGSDLYAEVSAHLYHQVTTISRASRAYPNMSRLSRHQVKPMVEGEYPEYWQCSANCGFEVDTDENLFTLCRRPAPEEGIILIKDKVHVEFRGAARGEGKLAFSLRAHRLDPMEQEWLPIVGGDEKVIVVHATSSIPEPEIRAAILEGTATYLGKQIGYEVGPLAPTEIEDDTYVYDVGADAFKTLENNIAWPLPA